MDPVMKSLNPREAFETIGETYSKAEAVYVGWKTDVNLRPPSDLKERLLEIDPHVYTYYNSLQYSLFETNRPETVDRTEYPRTDHTQERIVVAVLSSPVECLSILLEGGRQFPDGFHLILSSLWVSKVPSDVPGLWTLLIHKAVTFHRDGFTYIDEFNPPRKCTYLLNFFTYNITGGQRSDGNELEKDLDCPMSSSVELAALVDDKVWTRVIMADVGLDVPETLAVYYRTERQFDSNHGHIKVLMLEDKDELPHIHQEVKTFLQQPFMQGIQKIVVKPSWPNSFGSIGVSFHKTSDTDSILGSVTLLWEQTPPGSSILIESFIETIIPDKETKTNIQWIAKEEYGFRARVTVCRDFDDVPVTTLINCGMGLKSLPINGDNSVGQTLDTTLVAYNVTDKAVRTRLDEEIRLKGQAVLRGIMKREKLLTPEQRGTRYGETDVIGIDMVIAKRNGKIDPYGIEANSHDCTINCQIIESVMETLNFTGLTTTVRAKDPNNYMELKDSMHQRGNIARRMAGGSSGRSVRPFVRTMLFKSQLHVMRGKMILLVGAGGYSKRFIWPATQEYGIKVILVDPNPNHFAVDQVWKFIEYDFNDHTDDFNNATNIIDILRNADLEIDGCVTFWEDCVPLAALINDWMKLPGGSGYEASRNAKQKSLTQNILYERRDDIPHWPRTYLYASSALTITDNQDLEEAANKANYPAVLKLEHGSSAVGVILVNNGNELKEQYTKVVSSLTTEEDFPGIGLGHSNHMLVVDYHGGSEHDVDVVIFKRKLVAAFVSDNGPTRVPLFTETSAVMPSSLPADKQAQLITAAYQCCTEIGLSSGTFNVEMKMTPTGPKLIEINARMGGFYLRDWIKKIYGVDLMFYSLMVAAGVRPHVPRLLPVTYMMGIMLVPSLHRHLLENEDNLNNIKQMHQQGEIYFTQFSEHLEELNVEFEEPFGNIAVYGKTIPEAKEKLLALSEKLGIAHENYNVAEFTKHF